jgi:DNA primase
MLSFRDLNSQLPALEVLRALGLECSVIHRPQWRGRCPFHDSRTGRTLSVSLTERKWQCWSRECRQHGDLIDLWARVKGLSLVEAARQLKEEFRI